MPSPLPSTAFNDSRFNLIIIGFVLRMDTFSKNQKVGIHRTPSHLTD